MIRATFRNQRHATGSWLSDAFSNINWNPMASPVTQAVVQSTVQVAQGVAQVVTAPVTNLAQAVGVKIDWDPSKSPVFGVVKPVLDVAGVVAGVGPLGQYLQLGGAITQSTYQKPAVQAPQTVIYQVPAGGQAPTQQLQGTPVVNALGQSVVPMGGLQVAAGVRRGWPYYYRR